MSKMKSTLDGIKSRLDVVNEKSNELKDLTVEIIQSRTKRE